MASEKQEELALHMISNPMVKSGSGDSRDSFLQSMIWKLIFDVLSFYKEHRIRGGPEYIGSAAYFYRYYICAFMTTFRYSHLNVFIYFLIFGIVLN